MIKRKIMNIPALIISFSMLFTLVLSSNSHAVTMTFDNLQVYPPGLPTYKENGITATGLLAVFTVPGAAHVDDFATPFLSTINFSMDELFVPVSFDVISLGFNSLTPFNNVRVEGVLDGVVIASNEFSTSPDSGTTSTFNLLSSFSEIDTLRISTISLGFSEECTFATPCVHFDIDNVNLTPAMAVDIAPVPLPAGFLLMGSALAGLGLYRHKKNYSSQNID